jgi:chemotaxis signal transduction protein
MLKKIPPKDRLYQLLPELLKPPEMKGEQYLQVYLNPGEAVLLPMTHVEGVVNIPAAQITPLHSMPISVLGLMHSNGHICCAVDMATLLRITTVPIVKQQYPVMVLRSSAAETLFQEKTTDSWLLLGLIVHRLQGLLRLQSNRIEPPETYSNQSLDPYTLGWVEYTSKYLPILSPQAIFNAVSFP